MLTQNEIQKYADAMIWGLEKAGAQTGKVFKKGDLISLSFPRYAYALSEVIYIDLIARGFHVRTSVFPSPNMEKSFFTLGDEEQLAYLPQWQKDMTQDTAGSIVIIGDEDLLCLADSDPSKIAIKAKSRKPLRDILNKKEQDGAYAWTLGLWPSEDMADKAGLSLAAMFDQVRKACFLDKENPTQEWENLYQYNQKVCQWLRDLDIDWVHMTSKHTDLKIKLGEGRKFLSTSGHNIPSFEVFTSPDFRYTEGVFYADQATFRNGNVVQGARLEFKDGKCVKATADKGESFLLSQLDMDEGARFVGEFSLTDKRYSKIDCFMADTLYDENFGGPNGNSHIAVGSAYLDTYAGDQKDLATNAQKTEKGFNDSVLHWDLVNSEEKTVVAKCRNGDEIVIYKNGQFMMD
ncbi:MAG: aminopeptidase [Alphaproteobacteria bacterium]|nr:aminopeptidase [Alphaproteobacteria bacterium]MBN2780328.1 aminopeptidase [Alphaproteobacteria bacterium]